MQIKFKAAQITFTLLNQGYAALMSVVVISGVLLLVVTVTSYSGFFSRYNILEAEFKERSASLAEACVDEALLRLAGDTAFMGNITISYGANDCRIGPVVSLGSTTMISTKGVFKDAQTNLRITVKNSDLRVLSWAEIPTLP